MISSGCSAAAGLRHHITGAGDHAAGRLRGGRGAGDCGLRGSLGGRRSGGGRIGGIGVASSAAGDHGSH